MNKQSVISHRSDDQVGKVLNNSIPIQKDRSLQSIFLGPAMGRTLNFAGTLTTIKVGSNTTSGVCCVSEYWLPPGFSGPPPHIHRHIEHTWFVLEGEPQIQLGQDAHQAPVGTCVYIAKGVVHTFSNPGNMPCRMLAIDTPGDFVAYYETLAEAFPGDTPVDPQRIVEIQRRFDTYPPDYLKEI